MLRLVSLIGSLASLPLIAYVARRLSGREAAVYAVAMFSLTPVVIEYGSHAKQYATDMAATLAIIALTIAWFNRDQSTSRRASIALAAGGVIAAAISQTAVLVLAGVGVGITIELLKRWDARGLWSAAPVLIVWGLASIAAFAIAVKTMSPSGRAYMETYWSIGFMALPPRSPGDGMWLWRALRSVFENRLRYPIPAIWIALATAGLLALGRERRWLAWILGGPLLVAIAAAAAHQYPFWGHLALYLAPIFILFFAEGIASVRRGLDRWRPGAGKLAAGFVLLGPASALARFYPSFPREPLPAVLDYVAERRQPGDAVYVYYGAWLGLSHYGPRHGVTPGTVTIGLCHRDDPRRYLRELDQFQGHPRLWVIVSHPVEVESKLIRAYLDTIGTARDSIVRHARRAPVPPAYAYLYDLSDPRKLRRASSADWPVEPVKSARQRPCDGPFEPPVR